MTNQFHNNNFSSPKNAFSTFRDEDSEHEPSSEEQPFIYHHNEPNYTTQPYTQLEIKGLETKLQNHLHVKSPSRTPSFPSQLPPPSKELDDYSTYTSNNPIKSIPQRNHNPHPNTNLPNHAPSKVQTYEHNSAFSSLRQPQFAKTTSKSKKKTCITKSQLLTSLCTFSITTLLILMLAFFVIKPVYLDPISQKAEQYSPRNGSWQEWMDWSECPALISEPNAPRCGDQIRRRFCIPPEDNGLPCEGDDIEVRSCMHPECRCRHRIIAGRVFDEDSNPLSKVKVFLSGTTTLLRETDEYGRFSIENICNQTHPERSVNFDFEIRDYYPTRSKAILPVLKEVALGRGSSKVYMRKAERPVIKKGPSGAYRLQGQAVKLCCDVGTLKRNNRETLQINWYRNGIMLNRKKYGYNITHTDL